MTNGEKLQETFPNMRITVCASYVQVMGENYEFNNTYPLDWWYAEYKESTTNIKETNTVLITQDAFVKMTNIKRKYEKIKQIVDRPIGNNAEEKAYNYMMIVKDIKEVLKDDSN